MLKKSLEFSHRNFIIFKLIPTARQKKKLVGHISAFVVTQKLTSIEMFGFILNRSIHRFISYHIFYDPLKLDTIDEDE